MRVMDNSQILKKAETIMGQKLRCIVPFEHLMFFADGNVCTCCPSLVNHYTLGNIFEQTFDEIWNGSKAKEFRKSVINGDFKFCNLNSCLTLKNLKNNSRYNCNDVLWAAALKSKMPKEVHFNIDVTCNARCITCRDEHCYTEKEVEKYFEIMDDKLLPLLQDAEIVYLNGAGELFASKLCMTLVKKITDLYPKIKFNLITNGILANKINLEKLGLLGRIKSLEVSLHSYREETYRKIVRDGDYKKVMENLKFLSELAKSGGIEYFGLNFVVNSYNYKEMIDFQKFANSIGAMTNFWEYRKWGKAQLDKIYDEVAVFEPNHPDYKKYLKVINNKIFNSPKCNINAKLKPLE